MKLHVTRHPSTQHEAVEGKAARSALKEALAIIGTSILIPEPPFTGIVRRQALDCLRRGQAIWTSRDDLGRPAKGIIITMPLKILGILKEDGSFESADNGA